MHVPDPGAPFGFDVATTLVGSGVTLLLTAGIIRYGDRIAAASRDVIYATAGGGLLAVGLVVGLGLVVAGHR